MSASPPRRARSGRPPSVQPGAIEGGARLIKKYSNRKLYDTTSRQYITLERIGELLHDGENVQVIDRTSGEDLTAVTLSQVVLERERKRHGAAPEQLLQQLVRGPGEAVSQAVRQSIAVGQDFLQRAEERVVRAPEAALEETLLRTLRSLKIPSQREMSSFDRRLRELTQRVDQLAVALGQPTTSTAGSRTRTPKARAAAPLTAAKAPVKARSSAKAPARTTPRRKAS